MVLDSDTIQIYGGCQYGFTPLNSTEDKSNGAFEEQIVDNGLEFRRKLKTDKLADILTFQLKYQNYHFLKKKFTKI